MTHTCQYCHHTFEIERHSIIRIDGHLGELCAIARHSGRNMVYRGDMNREYAICPICSRLEDQWSAEARDQEMSPEDQKAYEDSNRG